ncbi:MAG: hypothetical protein A3B86_00290 [Candidatus Yanofskybacteria bacterium RIFCSPHIGHO2_02_FULL_38_22b]|uniref:Transglutaminase-like domain-containing protein n=1 Tax=Candidatus Yanofskybacteria bacterium RIFCSPHIGHO2_02_FULL_38_22b TaxID=1802673 RepID=A0A1F8F2W5_9BACT|nr:MAG: hypothetical protein A2816_02765 [Candidatus Yanofskybacteria bacterium RIFCSPHIGHO2_01_FULL_39_44]OGN06619.1 MAG: hypothetical protein A3B86_00290 [Candidatus Yanofskybacteria bacterium RIFCSPHIGHO2_02_FULL_38_22b]
MAWFRKESKFGEVKPTSKPPEVVTPESIKPKKEKPKRPSFEFKDSDSAEEYLEWKGAVPPEFRRLVESNLKNTEPSPSQTGLPLTDQFLNKFAEAIKAKDIPDTADVDHKVANLLKPMTRVETKGGYLNVFEALANPDVSWNLKRKIYDTQVKTALEWLANRDLAELTKKAQEEQEPEPKQTGEPAETEEQGQPGQGEGSDVPPTNEKVEPGGDMGERKEGEPARAIFSVNPFYGGYYKQLRFNKMDPDTLDWQKPENEFSEPSAESFDVLGARVIFGKIRGQAPLSIPLPYDWVIDPDSLTTDAPEGSAEILKNQDGLWYLKIDADGIFKYQIRASRKQRLAEEPEPSKAEIIGNLPDELKKEIEELKKKRFPKVKLKREIVKLVRSRLKYVTSDEINSYYKQKPQEFFDRIWQRKEANCFWANTLAARALTEIDNDWGYISGYSVREKDDQGNAILHSGNGHAWLEVWDEASQHVIRLDATPAGDPNVDQEQQEKELDGETGEGDYGDSEELASDSDVQKQIKDLKKKEGGGSKKKEKSGYDLMEQQFSELAECSTEQAKEFLKALERVRKIEDENGVPISDLMKDEWRKIIEERKVESLDYRGPVRMDEGSRLEDPVSARIDIRSRELNPTGFERDEIVEKTENDFGGLDIYFSFDLSGSMSQPDGASGRIKADVQRDVGLLFADSLMQLSYMTRQHGEESDLLPIKIMVTLASDTGDVKLHLTDKWGPKEQWAFYSALIQLARGGTPTHKTLEKIEVDFDKELAELKNKRIPEGKMPIQYTAEISDGAPDDFSETESLHQKLKTKGMSIRSYTIGGQSASADAAEPLETFSQLPQILAKDIIEQFRKLRPRKIKP